MAASENPGAAATVGREELDEPPARADLTALLAAWQRGDQHARDRLFEHLYPRLRGMASRQLKSEGPLATLEVTELLHEAYLKLASVDRMEWQNRQHFLAIGARVMRRILVDRARARRRQKRGSGMIHLEFDEQTPAERKSGSSVVDMIALDHALQDLSRIDPLAGQLVEIRYFGGLTIDESAEWLHVGRSTVVRTWRYARAWLRDALDSAPRSPTGGNT